jgi:acyl carrier protein
MQHLRSIIAFVFDVDPGSIHAETRLSDLPHWSSLSFIVLMTAIQHQLDVVVDRERAWGAPDISSLLAIIQDAMPPSDGEG